MEYLTTDNVAILLLAGAVIQLWARVKTLEDRKMDLALKFVQAVEQFRASLERAIEKLDRRGPPSNGDS